MNPERLLSLKAFFSSPGFKIFMEEFAALKAKCDSDLSSTLKFPVQSDELGKLNFDLGFRDGLESLDLTLQAMKDELDESSSSPDDNGQQ